MRYGVVAKVLGSILLIESILMTPSLLIAFYSREGDFTAFFLSMLITSLVGYFLFKTKVDKKTIKVKEGFSIVAWGWILVSLFGALPFVFSGSIPSLFDAFFETVSGFTTTGATILESIEELPRGILFWRSFTHWIGGMGILVFTLALLPSIGVGGYQIFKAESPGPVSDRLTPRINDTAKVLYITYVVISVLEILLLIAGGMTLYDASIHTFGTLGTGGFSSRSLSIGSYNSSFIHVVVSVFMLMSGMNFTLYYMIYKKKLKSVLEDEELRFYLGVVMASTILIALNLYFSNYNNIGISLRDSFFQTSSVITTTGYSTADFDLWPTFSKSILFMLMFIGGCAGSTGGSIKNIRILILLKLVKRQVVKIFHPRAIVPVKVNGQIVSRETVNSIASFFMLYILIFIIGTILISLEEIGIESAASSVAATLGNVGPGFGMVGPSQTYLSFSNFSKMLLSLFMLLGRLEIFTIIALIVPKTWRNEA